MDNAINNAPKDAGKNPVNDFMLSTRKSVYGFIPAVLWALEQGKEFNNWNPLSKLLILSNGKPCKHKHTNDVIVKDDKLEFAGPLKLMLDHILNGVSYKFDAEKDYGVVWKRDNGWSYNADRLAALDMCARQKMSIRHAAFKKAFPKIVREAKEKVLSPAEVLVREEKLDDAAIKAIMAILEKRGMRAPLIMQTVTDSMPKDVVEPMRRRA